MALIKCTECGKEISDKALTCPNCGCPCVPSQPVSGKAQRALVSDSSKPIKKKDSSLSVIACVFSGIAILCPLPIFLSLILTLAGLILGLIDLCINNKNERHLGSGFAIIVGIISIVLITSRFA